MWAVRRSDGAWYGGEREEYIYGELHDIAIWSNNCIHIFPTYVEARELYYNYQLKPDLHQYEVVELTIK